MNRNRQQGTALFIALMILVIVTVIGLSLASSSKLDLTAVGAFQNKKQLQETAMAAVDVEMNQTPPELSVERAGSYADAALGVNVSLKSKHESITEPPLGGFTLGAGFSAFHYRVEATATGMSNAAVSIEQGYYVLGPAQ